MTKDRIGEVRANQFHQRRTKWTANFTCRVWRIRVLLKLKRSTPNPNQITSTASTIQLFLTRISHKQLKTLSKGLNSISQDNSLHIKSLMKHLTQIVQKIIKLSRNLRVKNDLISLRSKSNKHQDMKCLDIFLTADNPKSKLKPQANLWFRTEEQAPRSDESESVKVPTAKTQHSKTKHPNWSSKQTKG